MVITKYRPVDKSGNVAWAADGKIRRHSDGGISYVHQLFPKENHDLAFLLTGENENERFRSNHLLDIFRKGNIGHVFISGGRGAESRDSLTYIESTDIRTANYLNMKGIPHDRIYIDGRSLETLGNFAFPVYDPIDGNPNFNDLKSFLLVTEKNHMERALQCAEKVIPESKIYYSVSEGDYKKRPEVEALNWAMLDRRLRHIKEPSPKEVYKFLKKEHPVYQEGWHDKPRLIQYGELLDTMFKWSLS